MYAWLLIKQSASPSMSSFTENIHCHSSVCVCVKVQGVSWAKYYRLHFLLEETKTQEISVAAWVPQLERGAQVRWF